MIYHLSEFFNVLRTHHRLPPASRPQDISVRLSLMASGRLRASELTCRALRLFIDRRASPS